MKCSAALPNPVDVHSLVFGVPPGQATVATEEDMSPPQYPLPRLERPTL